jgi:hypothetical protein
LKETGDFGKQLQAGFAPADAVVFVGVGDEFKVLVEVYQSFGHDSRILVMHIVVGGAMNKEVISD